MKRRIMKKHNNTNAGKHAPDYAKGIKVYELGFFSNNPRTIQMSPTNMQDTSWFMCYSTKPVSSHKAEYYNLVKKCRTAHSYSELISGETTYFWRDGEVIQLLETTCFWRDGEVLQALSRPCDF